LGLSASDAEHLLRHHDWDQREAIDAFTLSDPETTAEQAGIVPESLKKKKDAGKHICPVCIEECAAEDLITTSDCGHVVCKECFQDYLHSAVETKDCVNKKCPGKYTRSCNNCGDLLWKIDLDAGQCSKCDNEGKGWKKETYEKCGCKLSPEQFREFLKPADMQRYQTFRLKEWVGKSPSLVGCPSPGCTVSCHLDEPGMTYEVHCTGVAGACGKYFCTGCNQPGHRPAPCATAHKWRGKSGDEAATRLWFQKNTKKCPECTAPIEKNKGCMHMTCTNCPHQFCWLCKGPWSTHGVATGGFYNCSIYKELKEKGGMTDEERRNLRDENDLQKYVHRN